MAARLVFRTTLCAGAVAAFALFGGVAEANAATAAQKRAAKRATALPGRVITRADWESGNLRQWRHSEKVSSQRIRAVRGAVQGRFMGRFEVRDGEDPLGHYGERAEVIARTGEREGQIRWYSWSTLFPRNFPIANRWSWQVFTQWHSYANGSPPLGWYIEGNQIVLKAHRYAAPGRQLGVRDIWKGPIRRGKWHHIRMQVRWSGSDQRGWIRLWMNGRLVVKRARVRTMYPGIGNYFKQGYYRCHCLTKTGVVYHDGFRQSRLR